jgi:hypothetical protein
MRSEVRQGGPAPPARGGRGDGLPLLFLPGNMCDERVWASIAPSAAL